MKLGCVVPAFPLGPKHSQLWAGLKKSNMTPMGIRTHDVVSFAPEIVTTTPKILFLIYEGNR